MGQRDEYEEDTYRPRAAGWLNRSVDDLTTTTLCTNTLRRIQLEDDSPTEKWNATRSYGKPGRHFRRDYEEEYSTKSSTRGLPRDQPIRGRYFEEKDELDRYGLPPPVKRPTSTRPIGRSIYGDMEDLAEDVEPEDDMVDADYSEGSSDFHEAPYYSSTSRPYNTLPRGQMDYLRRGHMPSMGNPDTSFIKL